MGVSKHRKAHKQKSKARTLDISNKKKVYQKRVKEQMEAYMKMLKEQQENATTADPNSTAVPTTISSETAA